MMHHTLTEQCVVVSPKSTL